MFDYESAHGFITTTGGPLDPAAVHRNHQILCEIADVRYIRFHDLRHTFATHWMMSGGEFFKLQQVLGHASPQMTMRYAHFAPTAFAADYGRFGAALSTEAAKVVPLPGLADHA